MQYNYISIPRVWLSEDNLKSFNVSNGKLELYSNNKGIVLVTYVVFNNYFAYSTHLAVDPEAEYLCNSETEFLEKVQEAKLMNIISQ